MSKSLVLKASLLEQGINVLKEAKKELDSRSKIWLMDDYITASGISIHFEDQYVTTKVDEKSQYSLDFYGKDFILSGKGEEVKAFVFIPPEYMEDKIMIGGKSITNYVNTYTDRIRIQSMCGCKNHCKFCNAQDYGYSFNEIKYLDDSFTETELESSIINNLQKFLMELRKRICFCCKTTTYSNRKRRLLYRFGILQLYIKMFCVD